MANSRAHIDRHEKKGTPDRREKVTKRTERADILQREASVLIRKTSGLLLDFCDTLHPPSECYSHYPAYRSPHMEGKIADVVAPVHPPSLLLLSIFDEVCAKHEGSSFSPAADVLLFSVTHNNILLLLD